MQQRSQNDDPKLIERFLWRLVHQFDGGVVVSTDPAACKREIEDRDRVTLRPPELGVDLRTFTGESATREGTPVLADASVPDPSVLLKALRPPVLSLGGRLAWFL